MTEKQTPLIERLFTSPGEYVYDRLDWDRRTASITSDTGETIFEQEDIEVPASWSQNALNIVASKYFYGEPGTDERESSIKVLIDRVVYTISKWGYEGGYFKHSEETKVFAQELRYLLVNQYAAFNSPVWFNVGIEDKPQCSACFINSVEDSMESIMDLAKREALLFKWGSGTGSNLSTLRSSRESISGGGKASGPVSFMRGYDSFANVIKSGGKTRRAAKMIILDAHHPDIMEFISCKADEERKAWALIDAGYDGSLNGDAYSTVQFQNANHSVRVTDEFMNAVEQDFTYGTYAVSDGELIETIKARDILRAIAEATHQCGDPGMQFDTAINDWHTCSNTDRIYASNPCCFVGETEVLTSEGKVRIDALAEMQTLPYAASYDAETNLPVMRKINKAWMSGYTTEMVEVETEKGITVRCTPEHVFYRRMTHGAPDQEVMAKDLKTGMRLRKFGLAPNNNRSGRMVLNHKVTNDAPKGSSIYTRWLWEQVNGPIPDGMHVHHKNEVPHDDRISNFELVNSIEHITHHATGEHNPRYIDVPDRTLIEAWEEIEASRPGWAVTVGRWNKYVNDNGLKGTIPLANMHGIRGMSWEQFAEWIESNRALVNDKVKSIKFIECEPTPVYDIEVEGAHKFAVSSDGNPHGVIVHNSEYMFLNDTACNLASLNLLKFYDLESHTFDVKSFEQACHVMITAQEIMVSNASYPSELIAENSEKFRPLGLGYTNLGALLMAHGLPYDSDEGRGFASVITALMTGEAYYQSARIAQIIGPFNGFAENRDPFLKVMHKHRDSIDDKCKDAGTYLWMAAHESWDEAIRLGETYGYRNSQTTVLAPTGTIAFMMDCDTTGVEPDIALVKYKNLAGGGHFKIVNQTVTAALSRLNYSLYQIQSIVDHIDETGTIEGAVELEDEHLPIFDCAFKPQNGERSIAPSGHIKMLGAVQPFLSGAVSKTVNVPEHTTVEEIMQTYIDAWKLGVKAVAIYRDNSKRIQPLETADHTAVVKQASVDDALAASTPSDDAVIVSDAKSPPAYRRHRLPDERVARTHKFTIGEHEGYMTIGEFEDGSPGEVFVQISKEGSAVSGLMDAVGTLTSVALQSGVPLETLVKKFGHSRFEPSGWTRSSDIPHADSILDYVFRWMGTKYLNISEDSSETIPNSGSFIEKATIAKMLETSHAMPAHVGLQAGTDVTEGFQNQLDAPPCVECGSIMVRSGSCFRCMNCGATSGCS